MHSYLDPGAQLIIIHIGNLIDMYVEIYMYIFIQIFTIARIHNLLMNLWKQV